MDREARLSRARALLALFLLTACGHRQSWGIGSREFVPVGPPVTVRHIGHVGTGCGPPSGPLNLEARIAERVFRISNPTDTPIDFYYDWAPSFGDNQMFFIRFRDGGNNLLGLREGHCGWWSPKENDANLWVPGGRAGDIWSFLHADMSGIR